MKRDDEQELADHVTRSLLEEAAARKHPRRTQGAAAGGALGGLVGSFFGIPGAAIGAALGAAYGGTVGASYDEQD